MVGSFTHGLTVEGRSLSEGAGARQQGFAALFSSNGAYLWAQGFAADGDSSLNTVAAGSCGELAFGGNFAQRLGLAGNTLTSAGRADGIVTSWSE